METDSRVEFSTVTRRAVLVLAAAIFLEGFVFAGFFRDVIFRPSDWLSWTGAAALLITTGLSFYQLSTRLRRQ